MDVSVIAGPAIESDADTIVLGVHDGRGEVLDAIGLQSLWRGGEAKSELRHLTVAHRGQQRVIVVGLGAAHAFDAERARIVAAVARSRAAELATSSLCWQLPDGAGVEIVAALVTGTILGAYQFDRYKPAHGSTVPQRLTLAGAGDGDAEVAARAAVLATAQNRARDLGNTAPNELTPAALAQYATELAERYETVSASVLPEDEIRALGMGAFAAVAQGSENPAQLIALEYDGQGAAPDGRRLALIGKAVTFDSGGLSLKPPTSQITMKFDMSGGAAVIETVAALAELNAPVRVLAVVGATENTINGRAMKPGDVVTALDGTTIEIDNTDAEGRLVLADCITWARREGCAAIVDIATLTGAAGLGDVYAALMASDDPLAQLALDAGRRSGERLWRMPLGPEYAEMTKGRYAQLTNRPEIRNALAIAAAELLHHFVGEVPWAHLDIAALSDNSRLPYLDKGATGFGVRLLAELALSF